MNYIQMETEIPTALETKSLCTKIHARPSDTFSIFKKPIVGFSSNFLISLPSSWSLSPSVCWPGFHFLLFLKFHSVVPMLTSNNSLIWFYIIDCELNSNLINPAMVFHLERAQCLPLQRVLIDLYYLHMQR